MNAKHTPGVLTPNAGVHGKAQGCQAAFIDLGCVESQGGIIHGPSICTGSDGSRVFFTDFLSPEGKRVRLMSDPNHAPRGMGKTLIEKIVAKGYQIQRPGNGFSNETATALNTMETADENASLGILAVIRSPDHPSYNQSYPVTPFASIISCDHGFPTVIREILEGK